MVKKAKLLIKKACPFFMSLFLFNLFLSPQLIALARFSFDRFLKQSSPAVLTITDSLKRKVKVPLQVERILSLQPEISRLIVALGGGDRLVALDRFIRFEDHLFSLIYPPAKSLPLVAMSDESINAETVLRFRPDVLFVSPSEPSLAETLSRKLSIPVIALASMGRFDFLLEEMVLVGQLIKKEGRAAELINYFQEKLELLAEVLKTVSYRPKPRVYLAFWSSLVMTPVNYDPVKVAGGLNLAEGRWPSYLGTARTVVSLEQIVHWNPEIILIHGNYPPAERQVTVEKIIEDERLNSVKAVREKRIFYTFGFWYWWDPAEALFECFYLASLFYPEVSSQFNLKALGEEIFAQFYGKPEAFSQLLSILKIEIPDVALRK
ncbi:MAG: ABC transporter substrate-binding protein [Candidatus Aminicenantes bacterium]|nr:ABC transporter substrate-binding protein [Candidatus Aminicenantes bacterium]